jgi:hypothetical protein
MPGHAALKQPAARRTRPSPFPVAKLPPGWLQLYSERARQVVGMCIDAMHERLSDPASLRDVPLRDLAQAAQRTQLTAALLASAEQYGKRGPTNDRAPDDAADYLDSVSTVKGSSQRVESVCFDASSPTCARSKEGDPQPCIELIDTAASAETGELT